MRNDLVINVIESNDSSTLVDLLEQAPELINQPINRYGDTPLIHACYVGKIEIVKLLLIYPQLEVLQGDNAGRSALYWARYQENEEIVSLLSHHLLDKYQAIALKDSLARELEQIIEELFHLRTYFSPAVYNSILMSAMQKESWLFINHTISYLLKKTDRYSPLLVKSLLILIIQYGRLDLLTTILDHEPKLLNAALNKYEDTPLILAAYHGHPDLIEELLRHGANPLIHDSKHNTALFWAAGIKDSAKRACITRRLEESLLPLITNMLCVPENLAKELLAILGQKNIFSPDIIINSMLDALRQQNDPIAQALIALAKLKHIEMEECLKKCLIGLIEKDEIFLLPKILCYYPNLINSPITETHQTPLMYAVFLRKPFIVSLLLDCGANILCTTAQGYYAWDFAEAEGEDPDSQAIQKLLEEAYQKKVKALNHFDYSTVVAEKINLIHYATQQKLPIDNIGLCFATALARNIELLVEAYFEYLLELQIDHLIQAFLLNDRLPTEQKISLLLKCLNNRNELHHLSYFPLLAAENTSVYSALRAKFDEEQSNAFWASVQKGNLAESGVLTRRFLHQPLWIPAETVPTRNGRGKKFEKSHELAIVGAITRGHDTAAWYLLQKGADPFACNANGISIYSLCHSNGLCAFISTLQQFHHQFDQAIAGLFKVFELQLGTLSGVAPKTTYDLLVIRLLEIILKNSVPLQTEKLSPRHKIDLFCLLQALLEIFNSTQELNSLQQKLKQLFELRAAWIRNTELDYCYEMAEFSVNAILHQIVAVVFESEINEEHTPLDILLHAAKTQGRAGPWKNVYWQTSLPPATQIFRVDEDEIHEYNLVIDRAIETLQLNKMRLAQIWLGSDCRTQPGDLGPPLSDHALMFLQQRSPALKTLVQYTRQLDKCDRQETNYLKIFQDFHASLRKGSMSNSHAPDADRAELNAGSSAYDGVATFRVWWNQLDEDTRETIRSLKAKNGIKEIGYILAITIGDVSPSKQYNFPEDRGDPTYCIALQGKDLQDILSDQQASRQLLTMSRSQLTRIKLSDTKLQHLHRQIKAELQSYPYSGAEDSDVFTDTLSISYSTLQHYNLLSYSFKPQLVAELDANHNSFLATLNDNKYEDAQKIISHLAQLPNNDEILIVYQRLQHSHFNYLRTHSIFSTYYAFVDGKRQCTSRTWATIERAFAQQLIQNTLKKGGDLAALCEQHPFITNYRRYRFHLNNANTHTVVKTGLTLFQQPNTRDLTAVAERKQRLIYILQDELNRLHIQLMEGKSVATEIKQVKMALTFCSQSRDSMPILYHAILSRVPQAAKDQLSKVQDLLVGNGPVLCVVK